MSCKNCKYWSREVIIDPDGSKEQTKIGQCSKLSSNDFNYWDSVYEATESNPNYPYNDLFYIESYSEDNFVLIVNSDNCPVNFERLQ